MNKLNHPDLFLLKHTISTCLHFRKSYHWQSRDTQRALILKRYGVDIPMATFDRAIHRSKKRWGLMKQRRTGKVTGGGHRWTSAITSISWPMLLLMRKIGELTYEQFMELKKLLGLLEKRGPAKLRATPAAQQVRRERSGHEPSLSPT